MTAVSERVQRSSDMIKENRDDIDMIRRVPNFLVHCTLPQSDPGPVDRWERRQDGIIIRVHPHEAWDGRRLYPYGVFPRLLMFWVGWIILKDRDADGSREARTIYIGQHFHEFARTFDIQIRSKQREMVLSQMVRLFCSRISISRGKAQEQEWTFIDPTIKGRLAWEDTNLTNRLTPESYVILGETFYNLIREHPVPIDIRAICGLKHSAMCLDLYTWASYQTYRLANPRDGRKPEPRLFSWKQLMYQFGCSYRYPSEFKEKLPNVLRQVHKVYPELTVELLHEGLKLYPSRPAVMPEQRRNLVEA
jgi:hypothetical protein